MFRDSHAIFQKTRLLLIRFLESAIVIIALIQAAHAATQGTLGSNSIGSIIIRVTKPARARISNLSDLTIDSWATGDGDKILTDDVCVYSTRPMGAYSITAVGSGPKSTFELNGGTSGMLPYRVYWNAGGAGRLNNTGQQLDSTVPAAGMTNAATDSSTCTGAIPGDTARLIIELTAQNLDAARDGTYVGVLVLIVTPT